MGGAKLYVIPASHPSRSATLMLDRKGIPYKRGRSDARDLQGRPPDAAVSRRDGAGAEGETARPGRARVRTGGPIVSLSARFNGLRTRTCVPTSHRSREDLDRIHGWVSQGVLGGDELQIAPSVRLLMTFDDLRPAIERRPAAGHALRVVPDFPGKMPPVLPADWIKGLRS